MSRNYYRHLIGGAAPAPTGVFANAVAYYKLDETSGQAIDVVNAYNASLFGGVTQGVAGKIVNAYEFNGSTGYLSVPDNNDFTMTNGTDLNDVPFTIRMWVSFDDITGFKWLINKRDDINTKSEWQFALYGGDFYFACFEKGRTVTNEPIQIQARLNNYNLFTNQFYHLVATYDGSKSEQGLSIYIDSQDLTNFRINQNNYQGMSSTSSTVAIGTTGWTASTGPFSGKLDEIAIIKNEAWTPSQVAEDYNNGLGTTITI